MSMERRNVIPRSLVVLGLLFGVFLASPTSHAQETVIMVPVDDRDLPEGSQIPEQRLLEIEQNVKATKEEMRARSSLQRQESQPEAESAEPEAEKP